MNIGDSTITMNNTGAIPKRSMDSHGFELSKKPCIPVEHVSKPVDTTNQFKPLSMDSTQPGPSSAPQAQSNPPAPLAPQATIKRMPLIIVRVLVEPSLLTKLKAAGPTCYLSTSRTDSD